MRPIVTDWVVWSVGLSVCLSGCWALQKQLQLRDVAMATIFWPLCMGCTLALPGEYDWTFYVQRQCGLMSNYFDHLLLCEEATFAEYWKHFMVCFNDVCEFCYNSARSERIWMKFEALWVYCLELALTDFGRDPRRSESGRARLRFVFLSTK